MLEIKGIIASIAVILAIVAVFALVIRGMIKDKKSGKSSCGGGCAGCPMQGKCHSAKPESK